MKFETSNPGVIARRSLLAISNLPVMDCFVIGTAAAFAMTVKRLIFL
jgi:hypothetical protein